MLAYSPIDPSTAEYIAVATIGELPNGERKILEIDGLPLAVFNIAGEYFAIADVCSHDDGPVAEGYAYDHEIQCPRHGARFDLRTGKVLSLPAIADIPSYPVKVQGDKILVGLPPDR